MVKSGGGAGAVSGSRLQVQLQNARTVGSSSLLAVGHGTLASVFEPYQAAPLFPPDLGANGPSGPKTFTLGQHSGNSCDTLQVACMHTTTQQQRKEQVKTLRVVHKGQCSAMPCQ